MDLQGKQIYLYLKADGTAEEIEWMGEMPLVDMREWVGGTVEVGAPLEPEGRPLVIMRSDAKSGEINPHLIGHRGNLLIARLTYEHAGAEPHIMGLTYEQLVRLRQRFGLPEPPPIKREIG